MSNINLDTRINNIYSDYTAGTATTSKTIGDAPFIPEAAKGAEKASTPLIPPPSSANESFSFVGIPSFGATLISLITEMSSKQRQSVRDQKALQTEMNIDNIQEQAKEMRNKAITQLCFGVVSGAVSIAQGITSSAMMGKGLNDIKQNYDTDGNKLFGPFGKGVANLSYSNKNQAEMALNTQVQAFNSAMGGSAGSLNSVGQAVGGFFDAEISELQADQEGIKAMQDSFDSLEQALKELIQKALSTQDAIQQNINQTRTKILG